MRPEVRKLRLELYDRLSPEWRTLGELKAASAASLHVVHRHLTFMAASGQIEFSRHRSEATGKMGDHFRKRSDGDGR